MLKIFLASHGSLASGVKSSLDILIGASEKVTVFDAYLNQETVQVHVEDFYQTVSKEDQVILLSDLYGGSVNQVLFLYLDRANTMLVAGVNLALVLELAVRESITEEELMDLVEQSKEMIRYIPKDVEVTVEEDFF